MCAEGSTFAEEDRNSKREQLGAIAAKAEQVGCAVQGRGSSCVRLRRCPVACVRPLCARICVPPSCTHLRLRPGQGGRCRGSDGRLGGQARDGRAAIQWAEGRHVPHSQPPFSPSVARGGRSPPVRPRRDRFPGRSRTLARATLDALRPSSPVCLANAPVNCAGKCAGVPAAVLQVVRSPYSGDELPPAAQWFRARGCLVPSTRVSRPRLKLRCAPCRRLFTARVHVFQECVAEVPPILRNPMFGAPETSADGADATPAVPAAVPAAAAALPAVPQEAEGEDAATPQVVVAVQPATAELNPYDAMSP